MICINSYTNYTQTKIIKSIRLDVCMYQNMSYVLYQGVLFIFNSYSVKIMILNLIKAFIGF